MNHNNGRACFLKEVGLRTFLTTAKHPIQAGNFPRPDTLFRCLSVWLAVCVQFGANTSREPFVIDRKQHTQLHAQCHRSRALQASMHQVLTVLCVVVVVAVIVKGEANDKKILRSAWVEQYLPDEKCTDNKLYGTCEGTEFEKLQNKNCCLTGYVLHCRQLNGTVLACLPRITCPEGHFAKLYIEETQNGKRARLECQQCDNGTFQNKATPSDKFRNNQCETTKTTCTVEPRIYYDEGNASEDAKCACDFMKGYAPVNPNCKYIDETKNCVCIHKKCGEEEELSQNYTCEKKSTTTQGYYSTSREFTDSMTTPASRNLSTLTTSSVNTTARAGIQDGGLKDFEIVIIVIVVLIVVLIGVAILVFCIVRKKRKELPVPATGNYTVVPSQPDTEV